MVRGDQLLFPRDLFQRHGSELLVLYGQHKAVVTFSQQLGAARAQPGGKDTVRGRGRPSTLQMAKNAQARLLARQALQLLGETNRVANMFLMEFFEIGRGPVLFLSVFGLSFLVREFSDLLGFTNRQRAFCDHDNAEVLALSGPFSNSLGDPLNVIGDFRDKNDIRPAGHAGLESQPARPMAHHFDYDNPVVAGRGRMQPVYGFGRDAHRSIKPERDVGLGNIVVNRFGQGNDIQVRFFEPQRVFLCATSAQTDQCIEMMPPIGINDGIRHVMDFAANGHPVRFIPTGAENGSAVGQNARERFSVQLQGLILHQSTETVLKADKPDVIGVQTGLADCTNSRVESGTITTAGQNTDVLCHAPILRSPPVRCRERVTKAGMCRRMFRTLADPGGRNKSAAEEKRIMRRTNACKLQYFSHR